MTEPGKFQPPEHYTDNDLVQAYLLGWNDESGEMYEWAAEEMDILVWDDPDRAWRLILMLTQRSTSDDQLSVIAGGPMEDLLARHGTVYIDRIEHRVTIDPKFKHMLGAVWRSQMMEEVWNRLQAVRDGSW